MPNSNVTLVRTTSNANSVTYRNPQDFSQGVTIRKEVKPVKRKDAEYFHTKTYINVFGITKVTGACTTDCVTSPKVVKLEISGPASQPTEAERKILMAVLAAHDPDVPYFTDTPSLTVQLS